MVEGATSVTVTFVASPITDEAAITASGACVSSQSVHNFGDLHIRNGAWCLQGHKCLLLPEFYVLKDIEHRVGATESEHIGVGRRLRAEDHSETLHLREAAEDRIEPGPAVHEIIAGGWGDQPWTATDGGMWVALMSRQIPQLGRSPRARSLAT